MRLEGDHRRRSGPPEPADREIPTSIQLPHLETHGQRVSLPNIGQLIRVDSRRRYDAARSITMRPGDRRRSTDRPPPEEAPQKVSPAHIAVMLILGGPVVAIGACALVMNAGADDSMLYIGGSIGFIAVAYWLLNRLSNKPNKD